MICYNLGCYLSFYFYQLLQIVTWKQFLKDQQWFLID